MPQSLFQQKLAELKSPNEESIFQRQLEAMRALPREPEASLLTSPENRFRPPIDVDKDRADQFLAPLPGEDFKFKPGPLPGELNRQRREALQDRFQNASAFILGHDKAKGGTDAEKLEAINGFLKQMGKPEISEMPATKTTGEAIKEQFGTSEGILNKPPILGTVLTLPELYLTHSASKRAERGERLSNGEFERLVKFQEQMVEALRDKNIGAKAIDILGDSIPFMLEFLISGGTVPLAKKGTAKGLTRTVGSTIKGAVAGSGRLSVGAAKKLPFFTHRVAAQTIQKMIPGLVAAPDQDFQFVVANPGESFGKALANSALDTYIEIFSESTGQVVGGFVSSVARKVGLKPMRMGVQQFMDSIGFQGVLGEMSEERIGEAMRNSVSLFPGVDIQDPLPSFEDLLAEAAAFSVFPGAAHGVNAALNQLSKLSYEDAVKAAAFEQKLNKVADKSEAGEPITRSDMRGVTNDRLDGEQREIFADQLARKRETITRRGVGRRDMVEKTIDATPTPTSRTIGDESGIKHTGEQTQGGPLSAEQEEIAKITKAQLEGVESEAREAIGDVVRASEGQPLQTKSFEGRPTTLVNVDATPTVTGKSFSPEGTQITVFGEVGTATIHGQNVDVAETTGGVDPVANVTPTQEQVDAGPPEVPRETRRPGYQPPNYAARMWSLDDVVKSVRNGVGRTSAFIQRYLQKEGMLPRSTFKSKVEKDAWVASQVMAVKFTLRRFDRAAKESYGGRDKISDQERQKIDLVLKGEVGAHELPEPMRSPVAEMRDHVDRLSGRMIDSGMVEGDLLAKFEENLGFYINRAFAVFTDPKWAEKVSPEIRNKFKALLRGQYPDLTEEQLTGKIGALLFNGTASESPIATVSRSKLGSQDLSILKKRLDLGPEFLALMGEITDARANYANSVTKMAQLVANHKFLEDVKAEGMGVFLFDQPESGEKGEFIAEMAAPSSSSMEPLNGLYTTPEIKAAFERAVEPHVLGEWMLVYMKVNGKVKFAKTVLSHTTHIRNLFGNMAFAMANGHWRFWHASPAIKTTLSSLLGDNKKWQAEYLRLQALGIVDQSAHAGDLQETLRLATTMTPHEFMDHSSRKLAKVVARTVGSVYRAEDDVWKVFAYHNEFARYRKNLPDATDAEIDQRVAAIVRDTYPTYSNVPEGIRMLRIAPWVGTFPSFAWEVWRTGFHTLRIIQEELSNPQTRSIGIERLVGTLVTSGVSLGGVTMASMFLTGLTADDDRDIRRSEPPWSKNSPSLYLPSKSRTQQKYVDMGYTLPHSYMVKPLLALWRGMHTQDARAEDVMWESVLEATGPFLEEEIAMQAILDIRRNTKKNGGKVFNETDPLLERWADQFTHLMQPLLPGSWDSFQRIRKSLKGEVSNWGQRYDPWVEGPASFLGMRASIADVPQSLSFKGGDFNRDMSESVRGLSVVAGRAGNVSDEELTEAHADMERNRKRVFDIMAEDVSAAKRLGMTDDDIRETLGRAAVTKTNIERLISRDYQPYRPGETFLRSAIRRSPGFDEGAATEDEFLRRRKLVRSLAKASAVTPKQRTEFLKQRDAAITSALVSATQDPEGPMRKRSESGADWQIRKDIRRDQIESAKRRLAQYDLTRTEARKLLEGRYKPRNASIREGRLDFPK